jgi:ABC-type Fe3+ transport system substrate-binding protein
VRLPATIDLGEESLRDLYRTVQVRPDFRRFASVRPEFTGDVIRYAFTIPANAPDPELARQFAAFLLGPEGRRILEADHQPLLASPELDDATAAPEEVRRACAGSR